jgi:hypothetical protein
MEVQTQNIKAASSIIAPQPYDRQPFSRKPRQERSAQSKVHQLNRLTLQKLPPKPALYIEPIPVSLAVGREQRFWLVHQPTGLRVPGQFSRQEAEYILSATEGWDWTVDLKTREPACRYRFLWLLEAICKKSPGREVAA